MSKSDIWFPFYIGDYLADTMHLTDAEHGRYLLLLLAYYKNHGPLPDDDDQLASTCKVTLSVWSACRSKLAKFFKIHHGAWHHSRADFEIERSKSMQAARIKGANATNAKLGRGTLSDTLSDTPSGVQSQSQSQREVHSLSRGKQMPRLGDVLAYADITGCPREIAESFWNHFESSGWMDKNQNPVMNWKPKMATWLAKERAGEFERKNGHATRANGQRPLSLMDMKTILQAKEVEATAIRNQHYSATAMGGSWDSGPKKSEYFKIKREMKSLNNKIASMA